MFIASRNDGYMRELLKGIACSNVRTLGFQWPPPPTIIGRGVYRTGLLRLSSFELSLADGAGWGCFLYMPPWCAGTCSCGRIGTFASWSSNSMLCFGGKLIWLFSRCGMNSFCGQLGIVVQFDGRFVYTWHTRQKGAELTQVALETFVLGVAGMSIECGLNPACITVKASVVGVVLVVGVQLSVLTT